MKRKPETKDNRKIGEFMDYIYYHPNIDIDTSDCGGIYERFEIFSKSPILAEEYPDDDQFYFGEVPNPDYQKSGPTRWRTDLKNLSWSNLNDFVTKLPYDKDWNRLVPVIEKIESFGVWFEIKKNIVKIHGSVLIGDKYIEFDNYSGTTNDSKLLSAYYGALSFINWYNEKRDKKEAV